MITPRTTRLIRAPDLRTFHRTLIGILPENPACARDCAVIVPSRGSAEELRRTLESLMLTPVSGPSASAIVLPDLLTRADLYVRLGQRLAGAPPLLTEFEREVLLRKAARDTAQSGVKPPFRVRSGLIAEILAFYDELRRRHRTVADFERLMTQTLEPSAEHDRGAARLLQQTTFLAVTFRAFEGAVERSGLADEHTLRLHALRSAAPLYTHIIVAVADQAADRHGLWSADFDLLARLPHLRRIDVVATETLLATGFHQRLHDLLPGIEEVRTGDGTPPPVLAIPDSAANPSHSRGFVYRDREEELAGVARGLKERCPREQFLDRAAIVFQRPLPYLYLARQVFGDARIPYQALDALPLAAEPFAATIDLIFTAIASDFTRGALIGLLRSPHLRFGAGGERLTRSEIAALDRYLVDRKYLGGLARLAQLADQADAETVLTSLQVAGAVAGELSEAFQAFTADQQIAAILQFIRAHEQPSRSDDDWHDASVRARAAVLSALEMLHDAHAAHDPERLQIGELWGVVRRWLESQTFSPRYGDAGLRLMDAAAARFADIDELTIVGLVEGDWPERSGRSIFYPQSLLAQLGWPAEQERIAAARAQFQDLLRLPVRRITLSSFTLEDDVLVSPSSLLDEVEVGLLRIERIVARPPSRIFTHEALALEPAVPSAVSGDAALWLALRAARSCQGDRFQGWAGARAPIAYAVSHVEQYLTCPFRYFAARVLRLPEEREEEPWMTPQERGQFVHEVFYDFFTEWQRLGNGSVTMGNVGKAIRLFDRIAEERLARLPEGDRALERTLLLGSAAAPGLAERAFAFEIDQDVPVLERLLEHELKGNFEFAGATDRKRIDIRAKADRIDLLADGTLRIVDYKLGRAPARDRSLQLPVYGACAAQTLTGRHEREWTVSRAGYVAFREKQAFVPLGKTLDEVEKAMADGQRRFIDAVEGIERGRFPVQPDEPFLCNWCPYSTVCRKDYVGDE